ncbi:MAG TPA: hypothetical protein VGF43_16890 [Dongiaceae bacterium]|jgi:hypothetical protein
MQLQRNHQLPRGLDYQALPHDLFVQLPPVHQGYRYTIIDNKVLLVQQAATSSSTRSRWRRWQS